MRKLLFRSFSLGLFLIGIVLLSGFKASLTGAAIGILNISPVFNSFLGIIFIFGSLILFATCNGLEEKVNNNDYYKKRAREIFNPKYNEQDVWVSRWELDGIMDYIKSAKDGKGRKIFTYYEFEHGKDTPAVHPLGKHKILHINVDVIDRHDNEVKRTFLITDNPNDPRLEYIGIEGINQGIRVKSSVYNPNHPKSERKAYKRNIQIRYEKE